MDHIRVILFETARVQRYEYDGSPKCFIFQKVLLNCGHTVVIACSEKQKTKCIEKVEKTFSTCSHRWTVPCYNYEDARCGEKCERILPCGHCCQSLCGNCTLG